MFGGFCLLFFATHFGGLPVFPSLVGGLFFDASFWCLLFGYQVFLIRIPPVPSGVGCFCLESLILAQDERWRRA